LIQPEDENLTMELSRHLLDMPGTNEPQLTLGRAIQKLREDRGMSRQTLALRAQIDAELLEDIESGNEDIARWNTVAWIARAAGVSLRDIAALAEEQSKRGVEGRERDEDEQWP